MTRTVGDVIKDLDTSITGQDLLRDKTQTALVVGFEHECKMVYHGQPDRLDTLIAMVRNGGIPLGIIKVTQCGVNVEIYSRPLIEFQNDPEIQKILTRVCTGMGNALAMGNQ